jgi:pimeloyl-ACP methyl ester carboxylesterase
VGLSDRVGYPPTLEHTMDDLLAVMAAVGAKQPVMWGVSEGGPTSALFAATYPERISGLILYGTTAKFTRSPDYPWALTREQFDRWLAQLVEQWGEATSLKIFAPSQAENEAFRQWWARALRLASSPGAVKAVLEVARDIDVRHILPAIHVPALILHRTGDQAVRIGAGHYLAQHIPGAKWVELPGDDHWWWLGETEPILREIEQFLAGLKQPAASNQILATILSAKISQAGPDRPATGQAQPLPASVQARLWDEIAHFRGQTTHQGHDQFLVTFDGPSRAIRCAQALRPLAQMHGLSLEIALHAGECELINGQPQGLAVHLAEAMRRHARPGEILISNTVKELVTGAGFTFEERGSYTFEGVQGQWVLFVLMM